MGYKLYKKLTKVNYTHMSNKKNEYIVIHYTGNATDTALANARYFETVNRGASANYFVDQTSVYQCVLDSDKAWHVGVNYGNHTLFGKCTNSNSIGIEMCSNKKKIAQDTYKNTVDLTKKLMKKYNIPASRVVRHYDVCNKVCPGWSGWTRKNDKIWKQFKKDIQATASVSSSTVTKKPSSISNEYTYTKFLSDLRTILGLKSNASKKTILSKTITVSENKNNTHKVVKPIQKYLNTLGYSCGTADGIAGSKFTVAVKAFQKKNKCVQDGEITAKNSTWKALLKIK